MDRNIAHIKRFCPNEMLTNNLNYVSFKGQNNVSKVNKVDVYIYLLKLAIVF